MNKMLNVKTGIKNRYDSRQHKKLKEKSAQDNRNYLVGKQCISCTECDISKLFYVYNNKIIPAIYPFFINKHKNECEIKCRKCHDKKTEQNRTNQLGVSHSTAMNRLKKLIIFYLADKIKLNYCYRCNKKIESAVDFSIDHKIDWLDNDPKLFYNLNNVAFSHLKCNTIRSRRTNIKHEKINQRNTKKESQLKMSLGKAHSMLVKTVLFDLIKKNNMDICYRCGMPITDIKDVSVDHKIPWLNTNAQLFWDMKNIAFSHVRCNAGHTRRRKAVRVAGPAPAT
jgi:5-methylcytosine-specific restriction endonuclease McrA